VTVVRAPTLLDAAYRNSDAPAISFMALGVASGYGPLNLPTQSSIGILWLNLALNPFAFRQTVELWTGLAIAVIAIALLLRTAYAIGGWRATLGTAAIVTVLPTVILWPLLLADSHVSTVLGTVLLAWHLVRDLEGRRGRLRTAVVGAVSGVLVVTDAQLLVTGVLPYIVAGLLVRRRSPGLSLRPTAQTTFFLCVGVAATAVAMAVQGVHLIEFVPRVSLATHFALSPAMVLQMFGWTVDGAWYGAAFTPTVLLLLPVAIVAMVVLVRIATATVRDLGRDAVAADNVRGYRVFWLLSLVGLVCAFVVAGYWDPTQAHYLMPCYFAVGALIGSWLGRDSPRRLLPAPRRARLALLLVAAGALTAFAAHTAYATATLDPAVMYSDRAPSSQDDPLPVLLEHHLTRGYAGYWASYDVSWRSHGRVLVWPMLGGSRACSGAAQAICGYAFAPQGEYSPQAGPSFIITSGAQDGCIPAMPPASIFGRPAVVYRAGRYIVSVYKYDVASRFANEAYLFC
jgi:hypothetical protein